MNYDETPDESLVAAARAGDRAAFGSLVGRHARRVFQVCYRVTGRESLAEDAVQETFIKAWRSLAGFDGRAAFTTWLHRIAVNAALEQLRREHRHAAEAQPDEAHHPAWTDSAPSPERMTDSAVLSARMSRTLNALTALERRAFVLRHFEEMPLVEICEVLGLKQSAAKQAIFRAVKKMRAALQDYGVEAHAASE